MIGSAFSVIWCDFRGQNKLDRGKKAPLLTKEGWTRFADGVVLSFQEPKPENHLPAKVVLLLRK